MEEKDAYKNMLIVLFQFPEMETFLGNGLYTTLFNTIISYDTTIKDKKRKYTPMQVIIGGKYKKPKEKKE